MSYLVFGRMSHTIELYSSKGQVLGSWTAYNNVDSRSRGIWPDGRYQFSNWNAHPGLGVDSSYGTHGIFVFDVPGRTGMGVHAGRLHVGRQQGPAHPTMGCIRTTEEAMAKIQEVHSGDPHTHILVGIGMIGDFPKPRSDIAYA
ncbi:MAG TPA: hypothetical protein VG013_39385 [Gemmataceae bacterium]|nr:hypothetical protein [Gemmataceae bacterium]